MTNESNILEALAEQLGCYRRLAKLAEIQHEHVQHNDTERLIDVLGKRQEVLDQISLLEKTIAPVKQRWNDYLTELSGGDRGIAESSLDETRRLLEQITAADRNDALVLQQRKLNLGRQINQTSAARQVNRTYAASAYGQRSSRMDVQR
jgi:hypothetical protein